MKVLNNYSKSKRLNGTKEGVIGKNLYLLDKNNNLIHVGDYVRYAEYTGYVLYNPESREYGVALDYSLWYGDNKYDINGYGKFVSLPMDNGAKLELEIFTPINEAV